MDVVLMTFVDFEDTQSSGFVKKIEGQAKAFRYFGCKVALAYYRKDLYCIDLPDGKTICRYANSTNRILYRRTAYQSIEDYLKSRKSTDLLFIRSLYCDFQLITFLKKIRKYVNKIVLEIVTYPFDGEIKRNIRYAFKEYKFKRVFIEIIKYVAYLLSRNFLKFYVDYIVVYGNSDKYIWKIPSITLDNGIDTENIRKRIPKNLKSNKIVMLGVAGLRDVHGYDRVIKGIANYYKKYNNKPEVDVEFRIVGIGIELPRLQELVKKLDVENYVKFLGFKSGNELDDEYDNADVAVSALALHRIGLKEGSPLKLREYCAKGIPFIYAYEEKNLDENVPFALKLEANDSDIDIDQIVDFSMRCRSIDNITDIIRQYAEENYEWKVQIGKLLKTLGVI
ncbi:glycosyltransferase [Thermoanaerobacter kivui]|uniref:Glycosyltransferase n=1 Tax=Thermoanaerobacter kivui TaxID=2325 RepID=A0A097APW6_THEKI|nr:glycosyltransferase [Thermoanaerobacter kivui]AIS51853.1 glycosyltransferase [Thermoanaerobacter kivui]